MTQTHINAHTPFPLYVSEHDKTSVYAELPRGKYRIAELKVNDWDTSNPVISRDEAKANARLVKASFNAFNQAGRTLGVDAAELGESIDLVALIQAAKAVFDDLRFDELTEGQSVRAHRLDAQLAKLPKPAPR